MIGFRQFVSPRFVAVISTLLMLSPPVGSAAVCLPRDPGPPAQYQYLTRLVDSFAYAKSASEQTERAGATLAARQIKSPADLLDAVTDFMVAVKDAGHNYDCAARLVEPFTTSPDQGLQTSAGTAHLVYTQIAQVDRQHLTELRAALDAQGRSEPPGALADRTSELVVRKRENWKLLPLAGIAATHAIVLPPDKPTERLSRLRLTESQRAELLKALEQTFGPSVRGGMREGQSALEGTGALLYQFLADRQWKSLDTR